MTMATRIRQRAPSADRLIVVISDIEMGAGGLVDDFPHSDFLGELIESYNEVPYDDLAVELVFNGDTFDLLKTSYLEKYPRHITRDVALGKMARVSAAHPRFFEAVRHFLSHDGAERRVHFIVGNHDAEILYAEVRQLILSLCGKPERVRFPGFELLLGKVLIEHGSQFDPMFEIDRQEPFVKFEGEVVLNIPWASAAIIDTVLPLQSIFHFHDRLKPKRAVFEVMPELKELLVGMFWTYYTTDYWQGFFRTSDPTKKLNWRMVKELAARSFSLDPEVTMEHSLQQRIIDDDAFRLYVIGHMHQPACWSYGDRKVLQAGAFRNEYMLANEGKTLRPIAKGYVEIFMQGDWPIVSQLIEVEGPPAPEGYVPNSIFDVLPKVRAMLSTEPVTTAAQQAQEAKEAAEDRKSD